MTSSRWIWYGSTLQYETRDDYLNLFLQGMSHSFNVPNTDRHPREAWERLPKPKKICDSISCPPCPKSALHRPIMSKTVKDLTAGTAGGVLQVCHLASCPYRIVLIRLIMVALGIGRSAIRHCESGRHAVCPWLVFPWYLIPHYSACKQRPKGRTMEWCNARRAYYEMRAPLPSTR